MLREWKPHMSSNFRWVSEALLGSSKPQAGSLRYTGEGPSRPVVTTRFTLVGSTEWHGSLVQIGAPQIPFAQKECLIEVSEYFFRWRRPGTYCSNEIQPQVQVPVCYEFGIRL